MNKKSVWYSKWTLIGGGVAALLFLAGLVWAIQAEWIKSGDAAAWFQAVGSIGAVLIAVWVAAKQQHDAQALADSKGKARVRAVLLSLQDELSMMIARFGKENAEALRGGAPGSPFERTLPTVAEPFRIYPALVSEIGEIPNERLRRSIISAYSHAYGLVRSIDFNNDLLEQHERVALLAEDAPSQANLQRSERSFRTMCAYGDSLRGLLREAEQAIVAAVGGIADELAKPSSACRRTAVSASKCLNLGMPKSNISLTLSDAVSATARFDADRD